MFEDVPDEERDRIMTLEAFADTIIPGEKRSPDDRSIAGASTGPGAVEAGALELLALPATGLAEGLESLAMLLDAHATARTEQEGLDLDATVPPFVGLPFEHRTALVHELTRPGHPEKDGWVGLALFCNMAYDSAAHLHTVDALAAGHPGLRAMGFTQPDADGLWRFPGHSYGRALSALHPATTASGSPA